MRATENEASVGAGGRAVAAMEAVTGAVVLQVRAKGQAFRAASVLVRVWLRV